MVIFLFGVVMGSCAVVVFFRDLTQIVMILLQVGIWTVPILFDPANAAYVSFGTPVGHAFSDGKTLK